MPSKFWKWNVITEMFNPVDIYAAQHPLLKLSLISGIAPLKLIGTPGNRRLQINFFGFVIVLLHLVLFGICYVRTITIHESIVSYFFKTEISVLGDTLQLCIGLIGICTVFLYSLIQRNKFILWFHLMARIDEQLKEIGIETDYKSTLRFIFLVLFVKFIFFNTYLTGSWILFKTAGIYPNFSCWVSFFMPHLMISIIVVLFLCLVKQMKHRFLLLNKVLKNLYQQNKIDAQQKKFASNYIKISRPCGLCSVYSMSSKSTTELVTQISTIHDALCDACSLTEEYFTTQMLTTVTIAFLIIVFNTYYILGAMFGNANTGKYFTTAQFVIFFSYQIAMHFLAVLAIVIVSSAASRESNKTAICVHKLMNITTDEELKVKLTQISLQLIHRKVRFTACGLFNLDRTLIFTIVGATTTYLIILVQFTFNENDKVEIIQQHFKKIFELNKYNFTENDN